MVWLPGWVTAEPVVWAPWAVATVFRSEFYHHTWSAHVLLYIQPLTLREMESHHRVLNPTMKRIWTFYLYTKMVILALIWGIDGREIRMKVGKPALRVLK